MKKLSVALMALVILFGLVLALTPIIASIFVPPPTEQVQMAEEDAAKAALKAWFGAPSNSFVDVNGIRKTNKAVYISRFSFSTPPDVVRKFIGRYGLEQKELTDRAMKEVFEDKSISWWQPEALQRETWFTGLDDGSSLNLIYNAETQRGVLVIARKPSVDQ